MPRAILFANGDLPDPGAARQLIRPDDVLIAADGGARHAIKLGLIPSVIIGDFDSLSDAEIRVFGDMGIHMLRYPPAKDETDLELALQHALKSAYSPILVLGAYGGRLDQALGILSLLSDTDCIAADVRVDDGVTEAFFITKQAVISGKVDDIISLIPWGASAEGVSTDGLVYPLHKETLLYYRTRGISNKMLTDTAKITMKRGLLLCVHERRH